nr:restriction endonuclease subunit S [Olegusella massiliensis]
MSEVATTLSGGTPKTSVSKYWEGGTIPFFSPKDVSSPYTLETEKYVTELGVENCNSALYPVNTVFLTARGTVGKVGLAGVPMAMNQSCFAFSGVCIDQSSVYQVIKSAVCSLKAKANGATFAAINTRDLKVETVDVPVQGRLESFQNDARGILAMMLANAKENQCLAELRDALLPKLMSGEIDVSKVDLTQLNNHLSLMAIEMPDLSDLSSFEISSIL